MKIFTVHMHIALSSMNLAFCFKNEKSEISNTNIQIMIVWRLGKVRDEDKCKNIKLR